MDMKGTQLKAAKIDSYLRTSKERPMHMFFIPPRLKDIDRGVVLTTFA